MLNNDRKYGAWAMPPEPVNADSVAEELVADVVILGAGIAGVSCALSAAQNGAGVIVLEKMANWSARGGNIGVASSAFMREQGYENDIYEVAREWIKRCMNRCDEKIVWEYLKNGGRAMDWLMELITRPEYGARPALQGCIYKGETYREIIGSHRFFDGPMARKGARPGAADAVFAMHSEAVKLGPRFLFKTPGEQLLVENGRVAGAYALREDGSRILCRARRGVVLATGDIGGNDEMCEDLSPIANKTAAKIYTPRGGNNGDGHRMGYWAGGDFEDAPFATIMHPQAYHFGNYCFLFVRPDGERFMNEDNYVQGKCVSIVRERISHAWSIMDSAWREKLPPTLEYGGGIFWGIDCQVGEAFDVTQHEQLLETGIKRGVVVKADTPEELAGAMGILPQVFAATLGRYNDLCRSGTDFDFGKRPELLTPLDKPPYYGLKFGPALLAVVGGLRVDTQMRVLTKEGTAVDGLYAIGNVAGGRYGVDYPILIAGNSHGTALTFGYILGEAFSSCK